MTDKEKLLQHPKVKRDKDRHELTIDKNRLGISTIWNKSHNKPTEKWSEVMGREPIEKEAEMISK